MGDSSAQRTYRNYTIGWICALSVEMAVAKGMLDEIHQSLPPVRGDSNVYTLGSICGHNVVLACLPAGVYGTSSASIVATQMLSTFPFIRFSLLVGIGGGVPGGTADVRLGDVVVSKPTGIFGGVVQYDYGKTVESGRFQRTGALNKPPSILLTALASLEADQLAGFTRFPFYLSQMHQRYPSMAKFTHPTPETDILFKARYHHADATDRSCSQCSPRYLIYRKPRLSTEPSVHCGLIASGNQVMRDGLTRDRLAHSLRETILCFEMEAAGIMDHMPSLVIRGICDYADSHKNKQWQPYAAATAAAFAKELLSVIPARRSGKTPISSDRSASMQVWDQSGHVLKANRKKNRKHAHSYEPVPIRQGDTLYEGSVSNYGGVIMGNVNSSGKEGIRIVGSSATIRGNGQGGSRYPGSQMES